MAQVSAGDGTPAKAVVKRPFLRRNTGKHTQNIRKISYIKPAGRASAGAERRGDNDYDDERVVDHRVSLSPFNPSFEPSTLAEMRSQQQPLTPPQPSPRQSVMERQRADSHGRSSFSPSGSLSAAPSMHSVGEREGGGGGGGEQSSPEYEATRSRSHSDGGLSRPLTSRTADSGCPHEEEEGQLLSPMSSDGSERMTIASRGNGTIHAAMRGDDTQHSDAFDSTARFERLERHAQETAEEGAEALEACTGWSPEQRTIASVGNNGSMWRPQANTTRPRLVLDESAHVVEEEEEGERPESSPAPGSVSTTSTGVSEKTRELRARASRQMHGGYDEHEFASDYSPGSASDATRASSMPSDLEATRRESGGGAASRRRPVVRETPSPDESEAGSTGSLREARQFLGGRPLAEAYPPVLGGRGVVLPQRVQQLLPSQTTTGGGGGGGVVEQTPQRGVGMMRMQQPTREQGIQHVTTGGLREQREEEERRRVEQARRSVPARPAQRLRPQETGVLRQQPPTAAPRSEERRVRSNLERQLRDAIAHIDYMEAVQRESHEKLMEAYGREMAELAEERAAFELEREAEAARQSRVRRGLDAERKTLRKDETEQAKAHKQEIEEYEKKIRELDTRATRMRLEKTKLEKALEEAKKVAEEKTKAADKAEKRSMTLQREVASLRGAAAKEHARLAAERRAADQRARTGLLRGKGKENAAPAPPAPAPAPMEVHPMEQYALQSLSRPGSKAVSWANDSGVDVSLGSMAGGGGGGGGRCDEMLLTERASTEYGRTRLYRGGPPKYAFTKVTDTPCGCQFFEYSNADTRWVSADGTIKVVYFANVGASTVDLPGGVHIRHFISGQVEIYRPSTEVSLCTKEGRRTEVMRRQDDSCYVEIFSPTGTMRRLESGQPTVTQTAGEYTSQRGLANQSTSSVVMRCQSGDIEWQEPTFVLRWFVNGDVKIAMRQSDVRLTLLSRDCGTVKHQRAIGGERRKEMCVEWGKDARRRQREMDGFAQ